MNFGEKLKRARLDAKVTQSELAEQLNTTSNTISNWENNVSKPDLDKLAFICGILHVNASYFLQAQLPEDEVSITELTMIKKYRSLSEEGQETVSYILDREVSLAKRIAELEARPDNIIEFQSDSETPSRMLQYFHSVSAGTGQVIFDDVYSERVVIPDIPEYARVSYAVKVSGHSMEPLYNDGDMLLIEPTCEVNIGDVGIFIVGNEAYVKKLGEGELISLNCGYNNIPLTSDSKCMGRVVDKFIIE